MLFEVEDVRLDGLETEPPGSSTTTAAPSTGSSARVAGCDGFHGVCRAASRRRPAPSYSREYPFAWLGVLAAVPPRPRR